MLPPFAHHLIRRVSYAGFAAVLLTGMLAAAPTRAQAPEFLSIKGNTVNIRLKPTTQSDIAWELIQGYPVQVIATQGDWVKVKDFENTLGWVHRPLTSKTPHFLIKGHAVNLRSGPGTQHSVVTKLSQYDIVQTLEKRDHWAKVKTAEGEEGWLLENLGWGW